ncbi:MAG: L,D-transpeptidase [Candidatus Eisenbacteria bacterium]
MHLARNIRSIAAVSLVAVAVFVLLLFTFRNPQGPEARFESARFALGTADQAGAPQYAPEPYRLAEQTFQDGWFEMARQKGRLRILRNYRHADSLLELATRAADAATSAARDSMGRVEAMADSELAAFQVRLDLRRNALDSLLTKHRAEHHWFMAHSSLVVAEQLLEEGAYGDAIEVLGDGMASLDRLDALLADYFSDERRRIAIWRGWVQDTLSRSRREGRYAAIVDKSAHSLYLIHKGRLLKTFPCELARNPAYQKRYAGDGATPEGKYSVTKVKIRGSKYYKALLLDYPNCSDRERFAENKANGLIPSGAGPGGYIEIHGMGGKGLDWTDGCVALTNEDIDLLMEYVGVETPVTIVRKSDQWP